MKMTWTIRVSSVAAPSHGASDTRRRQHKMLQLQEEDYFLSRVGVIRAWHIKRDSPTFIRAIISSKKSADKKATSPTSLKHL